MKRPSLSAPILAIYTLCFLLLGGAAALVILQPFAPESLESAPESSTVAITQREFSDQIQVQLKASLGAEQHLVTPVAGRITSLALPRGKPVKSGSSPMAVDGKPLVALATRIPLWRDVRVGAKGPDVAALNRELHRLGYGAPEQSSIATSQTITAFARCYSKAGGRIRGVVPIDRVIWLPKPKASVLAPQVSVGDYVNAQQQVAKLPPQVDSIEVVSMPRLRMSGDRILAVGKAKVPFEDGGAITDQASIAKLVATSQFAASLTNPERPGVSATLRLTKPATISIVPPSSVIRAEDKACVVADGSPVPVKVVGSGQGQTFVVFPDGKAPKEVAIRPDRQTSCG